MAEAAPRVAPRLTHEALARALRPLPTARLHEAPPSEPAPTTRPAEGGAEAGSSRGPRRAAVLVPVLWDEGADAVLDPELLFIVRPLTLSSHSGQVAFPGGVIDVEDTDATAAALREAEEELGIPRQLPVPLGQLPAFPTHTGFHVTPIVAAVPRSVALAPSPHEVASHFRVRLSDLADRSLRRTMRGGIGGQPADFRLHFWVTTPSPIWGVTGQVVVSLLHALGLEPQRGPWR